MLFVVQFLDIFVFTLKFRFNSTYSRGSIFFFYYFLIIFLIKIQPIWSSKMYNCHFKKPLELEVITKINQLNISIVSVQCFLTVASRLFLHVLNIQGYCGVFSKEKNNLIVSSNIFLDIWSVSKNLQTPVCFKIEFCCACKGTLNHITAVWMPTDC